MVTSSEKGTTKLPTSLISTALNLTDFDYIYTTTQKTHHKTFHPEV